MQNLQWHIQHKKRARSTQTRIKEKWLRLMQLLVI